MITIILTQFSFSSDTLQGPIETLSYGVWKKIQS